MYRAHGRLRRFLLALAAWIIGAVVFRGDARADQPSSATMAIEAQVARFSRTNHVPGLVVEVVSGGELAYSAYRGFEDAAATHPVQSSTPFELGSNSKAFTATAIFLLEDAGRLSLDDAVSKYLPWFWVHYKGARPSISIAQLLHHTSGIPERSIANIPIASGDHALEEAVRTLVGSELTAQPGEQFEYATINYDILGLIIEAVTAQPYEVYVRDALLRPLGLEHTFVGRQGVPRGALPVGFKPCFGTACRYDAPEFRGNTPAAYILSTPADVVRWAKIQVELISVAPELRRAIQRTHTPDQSVLPDRNGAFYAGGWSIYPIASGVITHGGNNPNFSSYVGLLPKEHVAVVVLANTNNSEVRTLGENILKVLMGRRPVRDPERDSFERIDLLALTVTILSAVLALALLVLSLRQFVQLLRGKRRFARANVQRTMGALAALAMVSLFGFCLYKLPAVAFSALPWSMVLTWGPESIPWAVGAMGAAGAGIFFYYLTVTFTASEDDSIYTWVTVFSAVSGLGNALIVFILTETFGRTGATRNTLLLHFGFGMALYVVGQRFARYRIIHIVNDLLLAKRKEILHDLTRAPLREFEKLKRGDIVAAVGGDVDAISSSLGQAIVGLTNAATLVCCFAYLGIMNPLGLVLAVAVIGVAVWIYTSAGRRVEANWEQARTAQGRFFELVSELLAGFKELKLDQRKNRDFQADVDAACEEYKTSRVAGELGFADVFVIGELVFTVVIGVVAFGYPYIFPDIGNDVVRNYVIVFLFMTGPTNAVLRAYPQLLQMRVSWRRLDAISTLVASTKGGGKLGDTPGAQDGSLRIEARNVEFTYTDERGRAFHFGPVTATFSSGQVTFITGGNGSGKSTFAKLITGLYAPERGEICINGSPASPNAASECFSAVFSDFHLFERLYGIDVANKEEEIAAHLATLELSDVVAIRDGRFSTTRLSAGQRRRLALLLTYLENRPACLYDEWAADQEPKYRAYFYQTILPALRAQGKCVIVITHDDRYFSCADQLLKLELGRLAAAGDGRLEADLHQAMQRGGVAS